jgi:hypothetical protein
MATTEPMPIEGYNDARAQNARPKIRPSMDEESVRPQAKSASLREAEEYAAKFMESPDFLGERVSEYDLPVPPEGWSYEWKAFEITGKRQHYYINDLLRRGWRQVDASRHPEIVPPGVEGAIELGGLALCERPAKLTAIAQNAMQREAHSRLADAHSSLNNTPKNTLPRDHENLKGHNRVETQVRPFDPRGLSIS